MTVFNSAINVHSAAFSENQQSYQLLIERLRREQGQVIDQGRDRHIARHHKRNKFLPRERIDMLVDNGTAFLELSTLAAWGQYDDQAPSAGVITGIGIVEGVPCMVIANDATVKAGSFFPETIKKHIRAQEIAEQQRLPCIYLVDCGGGYLKMQDKFFPDRDSFGNTFLRQCRMSHMGLPQIAAVFGGCTAGGAYIPALSDDLIMVKEKARIHLGGPSIVKIAINEEVDGETLGGAEMHSRISGVCDHLVDDEPSALSKIRSVIASGHLTRPSLSPARASRPPRYSGEELTGVVNHNRKLPYDIREIMARLVDDSELHEFKALYGTELIAANATLHGYPIGILGNNGPITNEASLKAAHFIESCNQRNIPLLFLQNVPGYMVGKNAEHKGIAKNSAKMVYAMSTARVPRLTVIVGGSYGAANYGMCGRGFWPDFLFAWPTSEVAVMGADVCANILQELRRNSVKAGPATEEELQNISDEIHAMFDEQNDPYYATSRLWDDGLIEPKDTRDVLGLCLALCMSKPQLPDPQPVYRM